MRTTLTLDPDNAERLRDLAHRARIPFKRALNETLRRGLRGEPHGPAEAPFTVKASPLRLKPGIDPLRLSQLEAELDAAVYTRKTSRRTARRK